MSRGTLVSSIGPSWPVKCRIRRLLNWTRKISVMGKRFIRAHCAFCVATTICAIGLTSAFGQGPAKQPQSKSEVERCKGLKNELLRTRCLEEIKSKPTAVPQEQAAVFGTWQLARTPNPSGGPDSLSISKMRTNPIPLEHDVTGLMLRCAEGATTNVLVVLAAPLPPGSHPKVSVVAGATTSEFIASVVPPGALVLLPEKASALLENSWQSVPELAVSIMDNGRALRGVIPIADISDAMGELQSNCPKVVRGPKIIDKVR
jgi:hypothetical protein